jgi:hypothetical protein
VTTENDNAITIQTPTDRVILPLEEVESRSRSPKSLMPDELLEKLTPPEVRDLVAYLGSDTQQPLPEETVPTSGK